MACICGHKAGSPATQRIHENNCAVATNTTGVVKKVVKKAKKAIKKVVKAKK